MRLFIAEKPDLGRAIAAGIGGNWTTHKTHMTCGDDTVTWCFGHMLELANPEDYDSKFKVWNMADLPFAHLPVKYKVPADKRDQVKAIEGLIKQATTIVNAGDPDEEGQLLIDELLRFVGNTKPVMRVLINDNNAKVVAKAIANLKPNSEFEHMGYKAEARRISDQLFGYNLTRAYTLQNQASGGQATITIGRVQTPILGLIVRRDRANQSHQKSYYYHVLASIAIGGLNIGLRYIPTDSDPTDEKRRLIDQAFAQDIANRVSGGAASVIKAETRAKETAPPLPFNLLKLQQECSRRFGYKPDKVMQITQSLREKHQLITYNRSDCEYLSDEQHADAPAVLNAIAHTLPNSGAVVNGANPSIKGKAYNSSKVSAHHAIVPTEATANWSNLNTDEQNVYSVIANRYILQFYPNYKYDETIIVIDVGGHHFGGKATIATSAGWKVVGQDADDEDQGDDDAVVQADLRNIQVNMSGQCDKAQATQHETKPPALYTIATLMGDLARAAKYVKDPNLGKLLKEKDQDKAGEHGGIGTSATRSSIIEGLFKRGFITEKGKNIVSTKLGQDLYDFAADIVKYPDMSAIWFEQQKGIQTMSDAYKFVEGVMKDVVNVEVERLKSSSFSAGETHPCPKCGRAMIRRKGQYGFFWGCTGFRDQTNPCSHIMDDKGGKPVEKKAKAPAETTEYKCLSCGSPLIRRSGIAKNNKPYVVYGCSSFPKCKTSYWEKDGQPDFGK